MSRFLSIAAQYSPPSQEITQEGHKNVIILRSNRTAQGLPIYNIYKHFLILIRYQLTAHNKHYINVLGTLTHRLSRTVKY